MTDFGLIMTWIATQIVNFIYALNTVPIADSGFTLLTALLSLMFFSLIAWFIAAVLDMESTREGEDPDEVEASYGGDTQGEVEDIVDYSGEI